MKTIETIQPDFKKLDDPETFMDHVQVLTAVKPNPDHSTILKRLLEQVEPINFEERILSKLINRLQSLQDIDPDGPEARSLEKQIADFKVKEKHLLIETVESLQELAQKNNWGLAKNQGFTYVFNGAYWSRIDKEALQKFLGEAAERMSVSKYNARYFLFQNNLIKQFFASSYLPAPERSPDKILINLLNGTFEITPTGRKQRVFDQDDFLTYQLPFEYDPSASAPIFHRYLNDVLDSESQKSLAEFLGYVFISPRALKLEKALMLYGSGANGKSVFFEVANALLGNDNVTNYNLQSLTDEKGYQRAKLGGSLVNYASEISIRMDHAIFKQLVSGEPVDARLPYGEPFMLRDYGKFIFNCNRLPRDTEQSPAFFRRFLIVPFNVTIPEERQDKELHKKIIDNELAGVFNWVLGGLDRLLAQKSFTESEASKQILNEYRRSSDSVAMFIEECCEVSSEYYSATIDVFTHYKIFCIDNNYKPVSSTTFRDRLKEHKVTVWQERKVYVANLIHPDAKKNKIK